MKYFLMLLLLTSFSACVGSYESREHTLQTVVNGNTVRMKDGVTVELIGIENTPASMTYLNELIGKKVKVRTDKSKPFKSKKEVIYAYLSLVDRKQSINGEILRQKLSSLNPTNLQDSLQTFQDYVSGNYKNTSPIITSKENSNKSTRISYGNDEHTFSPQQLFKMAAPAVFMVEVYDHDHRQLGIGTGFFINAQGFALSNHHVFNKGTYFKVKMGNGVTYDVSEVIATNADYDCVLFKVAIEEQKIAHLKFSKNRIETGAEIFVLGNPKGLEQTLTKGIISAVRQQQGVIQIDAAISPGSSGSPVLDLSGNVIGIATFKRQDCENCNFAINIKEVEKVLIN